MTTYKDELVANGPMLSFSLWLVIVLSILFPLASASLSFLSPFTVGPLPLLFALASRPAPVLIPR